MAEHLVEWDARGVLTRCPDRAVVHCDFLRSVGMAEAPSVGEQLCFHGVTFTAEYEVIAEPRGGWVPMRKVRLVAPGA